VLYRPTYSILTIYSVLNPNATSAASDLNPTATPTPAFAGASSASDVPFTSGVPEPSTTLEVPTAATASPTSNPSSASSSAGAAHAMATGFVGAGVIFAGALMAL
jgi:hypothetical protein